MSCRSADQRRRSRSRCGNFISSAIRSVYIRTRSLWPRVRRSWTLRAPASTRIFSAAMTGASRMPLSFASCTRRARSLVLPALRATAILFGAWSGNTNVIFNNTASGSNRRANRSVTANTISGVPRTITHQPTVQPTPCGAANVRATMAAAMIDRATGTKNAVALTNVANDVRPRQRSGVLSAA
jgi:hypothetical protein